MNFRFELNKLRRGRGSPAMKKGNPSYAAVSLSDIRIPLLWRPRDHMQVTCNMLDHWNRVGS